MPFTWEKQPYQKLSELRDNYLNFIVTTTRKDAEVLAEQATQWMRQNAPWQDRPETRIDRSGETVPNRTAHEQREGHAREGLLAYVVGAKEQAREDASSLAEAGRQDVKLLKQLNVERVAKLDYAVSQVTRENPMSDFYSRMTRAKLRKPITSVPKYKSHVAQFEKLKAQRFPLVDIKFRQNPRLRYTIWLELAMGGRYAIIGPALDYWGPKLMARIKQIANLYQYQSISFGDILAPSERFERMLQFEGKEYRVHTPQFQAQSRERSGYYQRVKRRVGNNRKKYQRK